MQPAPVNNGNSTLKNVMLGMAGVFIAIMIFIVGITVGVSAANGFGFNGPSAFLAPTDRTANIGDGTSANGSSGLNVTLMNDVLARLRSQWYGDIPSNDKLTDGAMRGMVSSLGDPFTAYIEPQYAKILEQDMTSKFEGIGATLKSLSGGSVQIVRTFDGSPARNAGVQSGDLIEAVNATKVTGLNTNEVAAMIRGTAGTTVTLTLRRVDRPKSFDLTIMRAGITIPLVTSKMVGDGTIAYVSLYDFSQEASTQLNATLKELLAKKPKGLILDLRDNPGGYLSQAVDIGSIFLKKGTLVIERDAKGNEHTESTTGNGQAQDIPMVVLVNGGSASAAEIVAGAIQDYGRAKLFGETTFGKGSVQSPQTLPNGGQLRITIQHWYTPKNRGIHGTGIAPDYTVVRTPADELAARDPQLDAGVEYLQTGKTPAPVAVPTVAPTPSN
jgi:carboxyl-terminal processing protease